MIYVIARATIKPQFMDEYLSIVNDLVPTVLAEEGCLRYEPCVDWNADGTRAPYVTMMETWAGKNFLDAHLATPHMKEFMAKVAPMRECPSELQILQPALP